MQFHPAPLRGQGPERYRSRGTDLQPPPPTAVLRSAGTGETGTERETEAEIP